MIDSIPSSPVSPQIHRISESSTCKFEEFQKETQIIRELLRQIDGNCLASRSSKNLDSSLLILKNVNELESRIFGELVCSLSILSNNDYFHLSYSNNETIKRFIINTVDVVLNSDASHKLKKKTLVFLENMLNQDLSREDLFKEATVDDRARLDSYVQFFAKNLPLFIEFISIDAREPESSSESAKQKRNSLVVFDDASPRVVTEYESASLKLLLITSIIRILPFSQLLECRFFSTMTDYLSSMKNSQHKISLKITHSLLRKLGSDEMDYGAFDRQTLEECFTHLCQFIKTRIINMLYFTVIRMDFTLLLVEKEFGNFHFKYLNAKSSPSNLAVLKETSEKVLKSLIKSLRQYIAELYTPVDLNVISMHLDVFEVNVWNLAVEDTYELTHQFTCLMIKLLYWCSINSQTNEEIDQNALIVVEKKIFNLIVTFLRQNRLKGEFFNDYWKNMDDLWKCCLFNQNHKNDSPILVSYLCSSYKEKTHLSKVRYFGKIMRSFLDEKLRESQISHRAHGIVVANLANSTSLALSDLARVYAAENMMEEFKLDLKPALLAYDQIVRTTKLGLWFDLNLKFYPRLLSERVKSLRHLDSVWDAVLATAIDKLEELLDHSYTVQVDNYFIYDCLRLLKSLVDFYGRQMNEHKWLIDRVLAFASDSFNSKEKFASSLKENINYLSNEISLMVKQLSHR